MVMELGFYFGLILLMVSYFYQFSFITVAFFPLKLQNKEFGKEMEPDVTVSFYIS